MFWYTLSSLKGTKTAVLVYLFVMKRQVKAGWLGYRPSNRFSIQAEHDKFPLNLVCEMSKSSVNECSTVIKPNRLGSRQHLVCVTGIRVSCGGVFSSKRSSPKARAGLRF